MTARIRMLPSAAVLLAVAVGAVAQTGTAPPVVYLWPKGAPGSEDRKDEKENTTFTKNGGEDLVKNVNNPSLTVYLPPKEKATGAAIVICPGGGHGVLVANSEGHAVGTWLADHGIAGFVQPFRLMAMPTLQATFAEWLSPDFQQSPALELWILGALAIGFASGVRLPPTRSKRR